MGSDKQDVGNRRHAQGAEGRERIVYHVIMPYIMSLCRILCRMLCQYHMCMCTRQRTYRISCPYVVYYVVYHVVYYVSYTTSYIMSVSYEHVYKAPNAGPLFNGLVRRQILFPSRKIRRQPKPRRHAPRPCPPPPPRPPPPR